MAHKKTRAVLSEARSAEVDPRAGTKIKIVLPSEADGGQARRRRLLEILSRGAPAWDPADHPEIEAAGGAAAWVRKLRREFDEASMRRIRLKRR